VREQRFREVQWFMDPNVGKRCDLWESSGLHNGSGLPSSDLGTESVGTERSGRQTAAAESPLVVRPDSPSAQLASA